MFELEGQMFDIHYVWTGTADVWSIDIKIYIQYKCSVIIYDSVNMVTPFTTNILIHPYEDTKHSWLKL